MRGFLIWLGALVFVALEVMLATLILPSCALRLPLGLGTLGLCHAEARDTSLDAVLQAQTSTLQRQVGDHEVQLRRVQCPVAPAAPAMTPIPAPPPVPLNDPPAQIDPHLLQEPLPQPADIPVPPQELNQDMFRKGDLAALQGCWKLDSHYEVRDERTGAVTSYREWNVCFLKDGSGFETMRGTDGSTCTGPVQAAFDAGHSLHITEPRGLPCTNFEIYRREVDCSIGADGRAHCMSVQPERGSSEAAIMRRAEGNQ